MEKGMNLSGQLGDWSVDDLIQIVEVTKKTGSLDISGSRKGRIHFSEGLLTGAELHSPQGIYAGADLDTIADVVFVLGGMDTGTFAMGGPEGPDSDGHLPEAIAASVAELRKLEIEISESGVLGDGEIRFADTVESEVTLDPNSWHYLTRLIPPVSMDELEERFGRGSAIRMIHSLDGIGVLAKADVAADETADEDEDVEAESGWLEELAGGVSTAKSVVPEDDVELEIAIADSDRRAINAGPLRGISADASTVLTGGVYDEIRRLRSKVNE
jgi:Domain of unknown function (DUF4388)